MLNLLIIPIKSLQNLLNLDVMDLLNNFLKSGYYVYNSKGKNGYLKRLYKGYKLFMTQQNLLFSSLPKELKHLIILYLFRKLKYEKKLRLRLVCKGVRNLIDRSYGILLPKEIDDKFYIEKFEKVTFPSVRTHIFLIYNVINRFGSFKPSPGLSIRRKGPSIKFVDFNNWPEKGGECLSSIVIKFVNLSGHISEKDLHEVRANSVNSLCLRNIKHLEFRF
jgi:hypothetical protein